MRYNTSDEKHTAFKHYEQIDNASEFDSFYDRIAGQQDLIFRGLNEAKYKLVTSLQRYFLSGRINGLHYSQSSFMSKELNFLKQTQEEILPNYYKAIGAPITDYLYLSFLQHYEAPTTFMDFSKDINVALFFATNGITFPACITNNSIDNCISLYWLNLNENRCTLPSIFEYTLEYCRKTLFDMVRTVDSSDIYAKLISQYLSFDTIGELPLGYIDGDNSSRFHRVFTPDLYIEQLQKEIVTFMNRQSKSAQEKLERSIRYLFKQTIVIANLNQVAQKGCFIHYVPQNVNTGLEDYMDSNGHHLSIHCADINKSLVPYIQHNLQKNGKTTDRLFPAPRHIASDAYTSTTQSL